MNLEKLSKKLAYILRHAPWEYELELDEEGWVPVEQLLAGLHTSSSYRSATREDLEQVIAGQREKVRYQIQGDKIRALYGHSVPGKLLKKPGTPPDLLYHGTISRAVDAIRQEGLKPMSRQYVHLSIDTHMANIVGSRRGNDVVLLTIRAKEAAEAGVPFYEGNVHVWLADYVPPAYIS